MSAITIFRSFNPWNYNNPTNISINQMLLNLKYALKFMKWMKMSSEWIEFTMLISHMSVTCMMWQFNFILTNTCSCSTDAWNQTKYFSIFLFLSVWKKKTSITNPKRKYCYFDYYYYYWVYFSLLMFRASPKFSSTSVQWNLLHWIAKLICYSVVVSFPNAYYHCLLLLLLFSMKIDIIKISVRQIYAQNSARGFLN